MQSLLSTLPTRKQRSLFCMMIKKNCQNSDRTKLRSKSLDFSARSTSSNHKVLQNPPHASTLKRPCDGRRSGNRIGKARSMYCRGSNNHSFDTFTSVDVLSRSDGSKGQRHVIPGFKKLCRAIASPILPRSQTHRRRE